ncbi:uncharacterized protein ACNS7B_007345 [Menidia menidia]
MRVLWISCMLVGSITCAPQSGTSWYSTPVLRQEPPKSTYENPTRQSSGSGTQHYSTQEDQYGTPGAHYELSEGGWTSDTSGEEEPVFTPAAAEDQVYAFKSKAHYNKRRVRLTQFRYTPTEPREPQEPLYPYHGKTSQYTAQSGF